LNKTPHLLDIPHSRVALKPLPLRLELKITSSA